MAWTMAIHFRKKKERKRKNAYEFRKISKVENLKIEIISNFEIFNIKTQF